MLNDSLDPSYHCPQFTHYSHETHVLQDFAEVAVELNDFYGNVPRAQSGGQCEVGLLAGQGS